MEGQVEIGGKAYTLAEAIQEDFIGIYVRRGIQVTCAEVSRIGEKRWFFNRLVAFYAKFGFEEVG